MTIFYSFFCVAFLLSRLHTKRDTQLRTSVVVLFFWISIIREELCRRVRTLDREDIVVSSFRARENTTTFGAFPSRERQNSGPSSSSFDVVTTWSREHITHFLKRGAPDDTHRAKKTQHAFGRRVCRQNNARNRAV